MIPTSFISRTSCGTLSVLVLFVAMCIVGCHNNVTPPYKVTCTQRPSIRGHEVDHCIVQYPEVRQQMTLYPEIPIGQGDLLDVQAQGCAQRGGHGKTWANYTNPVGNNSNKWYAGVLWIRTVTPTSTDFFPQHRFLPNLVATELTIPPNAKAEIRIGYQDNNYSDNGYYSPDPGIDNQCLNITEADVTFDIIRSGLPNLGSPQALPQPSQSGAIIITYGFGNVPGIESTSVTVEFIGNRQPPTTSSAGLMPSFADTKTITVVPGMGDTIQQIQGNLLAGNWNITVSPNGISATVSCSVVISAQALTFLNITPNNPVGQQCSAT